MNLSIVFPAYNEELNIEKAVRDALEFMLPHTGEVIVVNDGSRDKTGEILNQIAQKNKGKVRVIHHPQNQGYTPTLRDGFLASKTEWVFYSDSDNQFYLHELNQMIPLSPGADIVAGFRKNRQDPGFRKFAAGIYNALVRTVFGLKGVRDIDCAFKLFRRDVFDRIEIKSTHFLIDAEILIKAQKQKMVIREVGVTHLPREFGQSTVRPGHVLQTLRGLSKLYFELKSGKQ